MNSLNEDEDTQFESTETNNSSEQELEQEDLGNVAGGAVSGDDDPEDGQYAYHIIRGAAEVVDFLGGGGDGFGE